MTVNMMLAELESGDERGAKRFTYDTVNNVLKRLNSWGYLSSRDIEGGSMSTPRKTYSITQEGLTRIED